VPRFPPPADLVEIHGAGLPPQVDALCSGASLPGADPLRDPLAFLLSDPPEDGDEQLPDRPARIEPRLLVAQYANAGRPKLVYVPRGRADPFTGQAIEGPDEQGIERAPMSASENLAERRTITSRAARGVGVHADNLETAPLGPPP
jgi:hypothetical protein